MAGRFVYQAGPQSLRRSIREKAEHRKRRICLKCRLSYMAVLQRQAAVTAYFSSKQLLLFVFALAEDYRISAGQLTGNGVWFFMSFLSPVAAA